ncbi:MAG: hypothetical protein KBT12_08140 [Bacteroidales bacterium]|nr:hypothetical protein [Candidatus Physcousia equi]
MLAPSQHNRLLRLPTMLALAFMLPMFWACSKQEQALGHASLYYWRTTFHPTAAERAEIDTLSMLYLHLFDVVPAADEPVVGMLPDATLQFNDSSLLWLQERTRRGLKVTPVVFLSPGIITRHDTPKAKTLARLLLSRMDEMMHQNGLPVAQEVQIDYDWTRTNQAAYFAFLQELADTLHEAQRQLSTTIRLHQLSMKAPPADRGILMCYNTGRLTDPNEQNSILTKQSVEPYVRQLDSYELPLVLALPRFSLNAVFHNGAFAFIAPGLALSDTTRFQRIDANHWRSVAYQSVPQRVSATTQANVRIYPGDVVRRDESSDSLNALVARVLIRHRAELNNEIIIYP